MFCRIVNLESTSKTTAQFETIPQCLLFFLIILLYIFEKQAWHEENIFLITFICLLKLKACNQIQLFTLHFIDICNELVSFHFSLLCKFYKISKFKIINNKYFHLKLLILSGDISLNPWPVYNSQPSCPNE